MINAEKALNTIGLKSKIPVSGEDVFNFRGEYIKNKNTGGQLTKKLILFSALWYSLL